MLPLVVMHLIMIVLIAFIMATTLPISNLQG